MESINVKNKHASNIRNILLITINCIVLLYVINYFGNITRVVNIIRKLEEDPRTKGVNEICMEIVGNDLYDLKELEDKTYNLTKNILLRFCKNIEGQESSCIYKENDKVIKLAGNIKGEKGNYNKFKVENDLVKIYLSSGEKNKNKNENYLVNIEISCNQTINEFQTANISDFNPDNDYTLNIKGKCKQACVIKDKYGKDIGLVGRIIAGIILLGVGVYIGFFGYRGRKVGIFLVCTAGFVFLATIILNLFNETDLTIKIIVMFLFGLAGIGLSIFFVYKQKYLKFYMILVGGITGYVLARTINDLFISLIDTEHLKLIRIIVIIVFVVVGVIFGIFLTKGTFIVGTSIIGSYCLMRSMSFFLYDIASFIDELKIYDLATHGNYDKIAEMIWGLFLIYPSMLLVFIIATIIVQIKINPGWRDVEDYKLLEKEFKPINLPEKDFKLGDTDDGEDKEG